MQKCYNMVFMGNPWSPGSKLDKTLSCWLFGQQLIFQGFWDVDRVEEGGAFVVSPACIDGGLIEDSEHTFDA